MAFSFDLLYLPSRNYKLATTASLSPKNCSELDINANRFSAVEKSGREALSKGSLAMLNYNYSLKVRKSEKMRMTGYIF